MAVNTCLQICFCCLDEAIVFIPDKCINHHPGKTSIDFGLKCERSMSHGLQICFQVITPVTMFIHEFI